VVAGLLEATVVLGGLAIVLQRVEHRARDQRRDLAELEHAAQAIANTARYLGGGLLEMLYGGSIMPADGGLRPQSIAELRRPFAAADVAATLRARADEALSFLASGADLEQRVLDWVGDRDSSIDEIAAGHRQVEAALQQAISRATTVVDDWRLGRLRAIEPTRGQSQEPAEGRQRLLAEHLVDRYCDELGTLLVQQHQLGSVDDALVLAALTEDRLAVAFAAARAELSELARLDPALGRLADDLTAVGATMFGKGGGVDPATGRTQLGAGGFLPAQQRRIRIDNDKRRLQRDVHDWREHIRGALADVDAALQSGSVISAYATRDDLRMALLLFAGLGLAFGSVFVVLARKFSAAAASQIKVLEAARQEAAAAAKSQSRFLANMSHEIRTPMNGILGMSELLVKTLLDRDQLQMASTIQASADALLSILNDILDYSKIEAGKLELEITTFNLQETIEDCIGLLGTAAEGKGVELLAYADPRIARCLRGDGGRLRQVLLNLLGNAVKFTIEGEVVVALELEAESDSHQTVRLEVRDTGVGITPEVVERLFTPFTQADASTTRRFGGTGLGLAICKRLIERMGGSIGVDSRIGQGSRFWCRLQLPVAPDPGPPATVDLSNSALLIVDDNETNRQLLMMQLAATGIGLDVVEDPEQALHVLRLASARGRPFTLALVDMAMPGMDGLQLAAAVAADRSIAPLRIAVASSLGSRPEEPLLRAAGVSHWIGKPLGVGALLRLLREMCSGGPPASASTGAPGREPASIRGARVLVAEDNEINRRVMGGMLKKIGCESAFAVDGREAVQFVQHENFDAVLMDCQMPDMDGYAATRAIRDLPGAAGRLPVIALTANVLPADRDACFAAGMDDFLAKPVKSDVLRATLERWLRRPAPIEQN